MNNILYYSLIVDSDSKNLLLNNENTSSFFNMKDYKYNEDFHITLLFVGCKDNKNIQTMKSVLNTQCTITCDKIAISDKFITLSVETIVDKDNNENIPYFGNEIKHITVALSKKHKGLRPLNSPTAFSEGENIIFSEKIIIHGKINEIAK